MVVAIVVAGVIAFAALVCYSSCYVAGRADRRTDEWFRLTIQENEAKSKSENLKNE